MTAPPRQTSRLHFVSHAIALVGGALLVVGFRGASGDEAHESGTAPGRTTIGSAEAADKSDAGKLRDRGRPPGPTSNTIYQLAWKDLAYQGLTRPDRLAANRRILHEWIREDWRVALDQVMREAPDDMSLLSEFHEVFREHPVEIWRRIESRKHGFLTSALERNFTESLRQLDKAEARAALDTLPEAARERLGKFIR